MTHRTTLADELRHRISNGEFMPGERLSENDLAQRFDVSRNTLREAFRVLEEQGLAAHVPHRGVSVTAPSVADVIDIFRVRRTIEVGVLATASPQHPSVRAMQAAVEQGVAAARADDWREAGSANQAFHAAIVALADSRRLDRIHANLSAELRLAFLEIDDLQALHEPFVGRNGQLLDTLVGEGPAAAARALERYLTDAERMVLGAYARLGHA